MIGRTNVGGAGGGGTAFAYIRVTYPVGGVVRCSDGRKNFVAKDTSGVYVFGVPYAATWTLTLTADGGTATTTVSITSMYQVANASLSIWDGVVFDSTNGVHYEAAGAWSGNGNITFSSFDTSGSYSIYLGTESKYIRMTANGSSNGSVYFSQAGKKIDVTAFSKMSYTVMKVTGANCWSILYLSDTNTGNFSSRRGNWSFRNDENFSTIVSDISNVSGSYYLILGVETAVNSEAEIRVSDIRFGN